jgi:chitodextrinase
VSGTIANAGTPFAWRNSGELKFWWSNIALAPGAYAVTVTNPGAAGGLTGSLANGFSVSPPEPTIESVQPSSVEFGITQSGSVTITGTNFFEPIGSDGPRIAVGGFSCTAVSGAPPATPSTPCVHVSRTRLDFYWENSSIRPGAHAVQVTNPVYAGAASVSISGGFIVTAPQPRIQRVSPAVVTAGISPSRYIAIVGYSDSQFIAGATVTVDNAPPCVAVLATSANPNPPCLYVGPAEIRFYWDTNLSVAASPILGPGTYDVTVTNPADRGSLSDTLEGGFQVTEFPEILSVEPASGIGAGAQGAVVSIESTGFGPGAAVRIGTVSTQDPAITLTSGFRAYVSADGGTVTINVAPGALVEYRDDVTLTTPGGYSSTCPTCLLIKPGPVITSVTPALGPGASSAALAVAGANFSSTATITFPAGVTGSCVVTGGSGITCSNVTVAQSVLPGSYPVIVTNPDGGRGSGALTVNPAPVFGSISPNQGTGGPPTAVTITGTGFQTGVTVVMDAEIGVTVTAVSATAISAALAIASTATAGYHPLTLTNPDGGTITVLQAFSVGTPPADALSALATYGQQGLAAVQYRRSSGAGWSSQFDGPALTAPSVPPVWQVMKASPVRDERILAVVDEQRRLTLHVWNGQAWIGDLQATASTGLARPTQTVDVAFEQVSGRGVVVYGTTNSTTLRYRIWDGTSWSDEALVEGFVNGQLTGGLPLWVRLESRPTTNDLVLVYEDLNDDIAAAVWNGSRWGDSVLLTTNAVGHDAPIFDVAFERLTGRMMAAWAAAGESTPHYRIWNRGPDPITGTSGWVVEGTAPSAGSSPLTALRLVGDISATSNRIALAASSGTPIGTLAALLWDGAQWPAPADILTTDLAMDGGGRGFDLGWEGTSGNQVTVYATRQSPRGVYKTRSPASAWSASPEIQLPTPTLSVDPQTTLTPPCLIDSTNCVTIAGTTLYVTSTTGFPAAGVVAVDAELIRYTSKTATSLSGLTRGAFGTRATNHASGATVTLRSFPSWVELAGVRSLDNLALALFDGAGRVTLARWQLVGTVWGWGGAVEAQTSGSGFVSSVDDRVAGRAVAVTLAQHLAAETEPGIDPPTTIPDTTTPGTPILTSGAVTTTTAALSWTAVGSDGATEGGMVARYELRRTLGATVTTETIVASQSPPGTENYTVSNLSGGKTYLFEVRAVDAAGNASLWSNRISVATPAVPPPAITDLGIVPDSIYRTSLTIRWTRPVLGPDSAGLAYYIVKYKTGGTFASEEEFNAYQPEIRSTSETVTISGLAFNTTYWLAVKVVDSAGNTSALSNVASTTTADHAPAAVTDLRSIGSTDTSIMLRWTMPEDDSGSIASYVVKYTSSAAVGAITTEEEFDGPDVVTYLSQPQRDMTLQPYTETLEVSGLDFNTTYWFSVKAREMDVAEKLGPLSNSPQATTSAAVPDTTKPNPITDLRVVPTGTTSRSLQLSWTATGDDGSVGTATTYDVRYATFELTAANFTLGTPVVASPPNAAGAAEQMTLQGQGLASNTQYFVAIKAIDEAGNASLSENPSENPLKNSVVGQTGLRRGYTLVSIPMALVSPYDPVSVFSDDVGSVTLYWWRSQGRNLDQGCYDGYPSPYSPYPGYTCESIDTVGTGRGYFLYNAEESTGGRAVLDAVGTAVTTSTAEVPLSEGFNMVGNPYQREIHLSAVRVKRLGLEVSYQEAVEVKKWLAPALLLFDGVVTQAYGVADPEAVFKPWNGGWIQSFFSDVVLVFPGP